MRYIAFPLHVASKGVYVDEFL